MTAKAHRFAAIGLVACSMLMHEILLTRICALRLYFHFAFLVISNCLLGLGVSGALLSVYQDDWRKAPRLWLGRFCAAYLVSLIGTYIFLLTFPIPSDLVLSNPAHLMSLTTFNLAGAVPFVFGGTVVGMLLTFDVADVNRLYAVDLIGAGIGCAGCPLLLPHVGAGGVFVVTALLALAATVIVVYDRLKNRAIALGIVLGGIGLALLPTIDRRFPVPSKGFVDFARAVEAKLQLGASYSVWTANSRIDLMRSAKRERGAFFMMGSNDEGLPLPPLTAGIAQDAMAGTTIGNFSGNPETLAILKRTMYSAAYRLKTAPKVLVIGLGGGNDVWAAKANGARSVKAIELNWPIVDIHKKVMRGFSRNLVDDPTVQMIVGEGRSALMRETTKYDVIQMSGIDTWTALASGAYVLAENYLYTKEAIASMYQRLEDDGILQIARFAETMEALRLLSNIRAALSSLGISDISRSVVALSTADRMMAVQVKKGTFSEVEQESVLKYAADAGVSVVYLPDSVAEDTISNFIRAPDPQRIIDAFPMNIAPTTDDKPYFFSYVKWQHPFDSMTHLGDVPSVSQGNPFFILSQLVLSIVLSVLLILLPVSRRSDLPRGETGRFLVYFSGLGLGFVFIEIAVIQKLTLFLGQPVYSLTVTLFSLLVFTGLGSLTLGRLYKPNDRRVFAVPIGIALYLALFLALSSFFVAHLIGLPVGARIVLAAMLLAPLGILLGIPFAHGLAVVNATHPALTPWAWAINGCASVVGSILTVVISMNFGFRAVLLTAAVVYLVAFRALLRGARVPAENAVA
jgi:spermidine synthase